jgi:outer membrane protein assembly factor BamB
MRGLATARVERLVIGLAAIVGVAQAGCAQMQRASGTGEAQLSVFSLGWTHRVMPEIAPYRNRSNPIQGATPAVDGQGNRVFVGSADDNVYCLRADSGQVIWRRDVGAAVRSQPLYMPSTDVIFVGTDDGEMLALGAEGGDQRWSFRAEGEIIHQPVIQGEALYFTSADDTIHALDWTTGEQIWSHHEESSVSEFLVSGFAGVAATERAAFTGFSSGVVAAFDAFDGNVLWQRDLSEEIASEARVGGVPVMRDVDTTPVLGATRVYVASYESGVYGLDRESGAVGWRQPIKNVVALAGRGTTLFAAQAGVGIVALDTGSGRILWRQRLGSATYYRPDLFRDLLIVPDSRVGLTALRASDGAIVQRYTVGSGVGAGVELQGPMAFVVSNGGTLAAVSIR